MSGLFGTLTLGARSVQAQTQALNVTGQNLANVNNPAYSRQRVILQSTALSDGTSGLGPQGSGVRAVSIQQIRDTLLDSQMQSELSSGGYWTAQQNALEQAQTSLGNQLNLNGSSSNASGLATSLNSFFTDLGKLSANPSSTVNRQQVIAQGQTLSSQFREIDQRLTALDKTLNDSVTNDVAGANQLLSGIADLNQQIAQAEGGGGNANDLRDQRQAQIESLAKLTNLDTTTEANGMVDISIGGHLLVSGGTQTDSLQTYDAGGGALLVQTKKSATPLTLTGGSLQGNITARDGVLASVRNQVGTLASTFITEVNAVHQSGFNLKGGTGASFFTGSGAGDIQVNAARFASR